MHSIQSKQKYYVQSIVKLFDKHAVINYDMLMTLMPQNSDMFSNVEHWFLGIVIFGSFHMKSTHKSKFFAIAITDLVKFGIPFHILENGLMNFFQIFWANGVINMGFQKFD